MAQREYDVVVFGATGFTGRLVAEQLAHRAPEGARIALAGRSLAKLALVREGLPERAADWPLMLADSTDRVTLNKLAQSTVAVATTVGPYLRYGLPLVGACAKAGTNYVDLTGEVLFIRAAIDAHHEQAVTSGARIVTTCGFDSIPSDLGVLLLHDALGPLGDTTLLVTDMRGGFSGGTIASMRLIAEEARANPDARALLADPYALSPDRGQEPDRVEGNDADEADLSSAVHDPQLGWMAPFVMAGINTRVVRRSNALSGYRYSRSFRYREAMGFGEGVSARAKATGLGAGMGALGAAMGFGPARAGLGRVLPKEGEGPSSEDRSAGRFRMELHTTAADGQRWVSTVAAQGDPGYAATSVMLAESVLLAALGDPGLPDAAGVLTPSTGLGMPLVERLRSAGMTLEVGPWQPPAERENGQGADEEPDTDAEPTHDTSSGASQEQ
jgi:short subunit dehydrogenase-like uncharacterized protein